MALITLSCDCGKKVRVKDSSSGKSVRCPHCEQLLPISSGQPESQAAPARARRRLRRSGGGPAIIVLGVIAAASIAVNFLLLADGSGSGGPVGTTEASRGASEDEFSQRLEQQIRDQEAEITRLGLDLIDRKGRIVAKQREVDERDARIRELDVLVAELEIANTNLEHQARKLSAPANGSVQAGVGGSSRHVIQEPLNVELSVLRVRAGRGIGSTGFFIDSNGQFITCYHSIAGAPEVKATYLAEYKGQRQQMQLRCQVLAVDEEHDLALLRAPVRYPVPPLLLESEQELKLGDPIAILDGSVLGVMFSGFRTDHGMVQALAHERGTETLLRLTAGVPNGEDGAAVINARGRVVGIVTHSLEGSLGALALPTAFATGLLAGKDGRFKVEQKLASWEVKKAVDDLYGGARRIPLQGEILALRLFETERVAYALERRTRSLIEIDLAAGTVKRKCELLSEPRSMTFTEDGKSIWVVYAARKSLHQIERKSFETMKTLQIDFAAKRIIPVPGLLCCLDTAGNCWIVVSRTGEQVRTHLRVIDMQRDEKKARLILSHYRGIYRLDPLNYAEAKLRVEALKKEPQYPSTKRKIKQLEEHLQVGCVRHYAIELKDDARTTRSYMLRDADHNRIYYQHAAIDFDDHQTVLGTFPKQKHSMAENETVKGFLGRHEDLDRLLAASPDGRWAADGTHLYDAQTFQLRSELPTPVAVMAFSADSGNLWLFDENQGALIAYPMP